MRDKEFRPDYDWFAKDLVEDAIARGAGHVLLRTFTDLEDPDVALSNGWLIVYQRPHEIARIPTDIPNHMSIPDLIRGLRAKVPEAARQHGIV